MLLSDLKTGESAVVIKVQGHGGFRRRILEMGFVRGQRVVAVLNAPLRDPIKYRIMGYEVSLRRSEAAMVEVLTLEEARAIRPSSDNPTTSPHDEDIEYAVNEKIRQINVALVGNPNSGKTSLFNALSGGHEHVGNYSGVTVDAKLGSFSYKGYKINITDLPGTYALSAYTPEELYVRQHLINELPDVVINAVVASNLERNLYLTTELIDLNPKMVVALNMYDELEERGSRLDYEQLGRMIGVPVVPVVARDGKGLDALLDEVISTYEGQNPKVRHIHINYSSSIENEIQSLSKLMKRNIEELPKCFPPRYWAIKMLEGDANVMSLLKGGEHFTEWKTHSVKGAARIITALDEDVESAITNEKYGFIEGALAETYVAGTNKGADDKTSLIDRIVTHRYLGFPLFLAMMFLMFWSTFTLGAYPQEWIEIGFGWLGEFVGGLMSDGPLRDLIVDGIIGGVGSVIVFLPNILILYLFISIMEDSGYMARAAFIMDRLMHLAGLHGKSFIPLVMGFGCNVPAIMATRTIESHSSRLITILINPFMSCSARLPVFVLLVATFFPECAGAMLFGIYLFGCLVAIITARLLRRFMFGKDETPFVMELPPYRIPTLNATLRHMWERSRQYLRKIAGLILVAAVVIWFLSYYPRSVEPQSVHPANTELALESNTLGSDAVSVVNQQYNSDELQVNKSQSENSYLGRIGRFIEPVMKPLGMDWRASVAILSGISAKEIVVSTLGVLYSVEDAESDNASLSASLLSSGNYTRAGALAMIIFILLYLPCLATVSAIAHEAGGWKWALFSIVYNTSLAWILAFVAYHLGMWIGL
ncbi:MAG: ferrous iron transport protein B [Rikenellaceae bacterium]|nr:ferrous iron transport protein B [Rikenellaceae bacterium]